MTSPDSWKDIVEKLRRDYLRPSRIARLALCPASGVESIGQPDATRVEAALGRATHRALRALVLHGLEEAKLEAAGAAEDEQVDVRQIRSWLMGVTWDVPGTAVVVAEEPLLLDLGFCEIPGTADVIVLHDEDLIEVVDFKTGDPDYVDENQWLQLKTYGLAAAQRWGRKRVLLSLCYVRLGAGGWAHLELDLVRDLERISEIARTALAQEALPLERKSFRVGPHCRFCPARPTCPALNADLRVFSALAEMGPWQITTRNAAALIDRAGIVERLAKSVREAVKEQVRAEGGRMLADDGRVLELITSERKAYTVPPGSSERLIVRKA